MVDENGHYHLVHSQTLGAETVGIVNGNSSTAVVAVQETCAAEEPKVLCIVTDETNIEWNRNRYTVNLPASSLVNSFYGDVAENFHYVKDTFLLVWQRCYGNEETEELILNGVGDVTLQDFGLVSNAKRNHFLVKQKDGSDPVKITTKKEDEQDDVITDSVSNLFQNNSVNSSYSNYYSSSSTFGYGSYSKSETGFVGLVNQAMTCYLNSLLQTLYMTPEFRNALYKWEFTGDVEEGSKSIPYQLQRLFVQLQTSNKRAVETTDITRSFGWDSSEAWQQHDVQELCRVMFDALESSFKGTDQDDLINKLYQGKMKDYVKCLECGNESARADTYLDIPLAIRPFGSNKAFGSVEESLEHFVKPETLDGTNQYFCEKCGKKCDAHKGLKFTTFPRLLTIQLKRFAFDFNTLHRIKLNDSRLDTLAYSRPRLLDLCLIRKGGQIEDLYLIGRTVFPMYLNLNGFVITDQEEDVTDDELSCKDDSPSSTETDSGVGEGFSENSLSAEEEEADTLQAKDSGIGSVADPNELGASVVDSMNEIKAPKGPYNYELFSIMIHSGSASGGHYYAYIKNFTDGKWYCFNDQSVTKVYDDEIEKSYGGGESLRGYYSAAYSSSTNAYMLMYRRVQAGATGDRFVEFSEMPGHIVRLVHDIKTHEEIEKIRKEIERNSCRIKVFYQLPSLKKMIEKRLEVHKDETLEKAVDIARKLFKIENVVPADQCRLVKYDEYNKLIEMSYDGEEKTPMGDLLGGGPRSTYNFDLLLETRQADKHFPSYAPGGTNLQIHKVNLSTGEISDPVNLRGYFKKTVKELKALISETLGLSSEHMRLVLLDGTFGELKTLESPHKTLKSEGFSKSNQVFVECSGSDDNDLLFPDSELFKVLDRYQHTVKLIALLPDPNTKPTEHSFVVDDTDKSSTDSASYKETMLSIDKRMTLGEMKQMLEPYVDSISDLFKVYRIYSNSQEIEYTKLSDSLSTFEDGAKIRIKYGRALRKGECEVRVSLLRPNDAEVTKFLFNWIIKKGSTVKDCKELLQPEICRRCGFDIPVDRMRLRKKTWKNPGIVYLDSQVFEEDIQIFMNFELFVEELSGPEARSSRDELSVYVRQWNPSSLTISPFQEVVLKEPIVEELKEEISRISNIPVEDLELAKSPGAFPCEISVLEIHEDLDWYLEAVSLSSSPLYIHEDGAVVFYRNRKEALMEVSEEMKQKIQKTETAKLPASTRSSGYVYKERALKIYTDDNPKKNNVR